MMAIVFWSSNLSFAAKPSQSSDFREETFNGLSLKGSLWDQIELPTI